MKKITPLSLLLLGMLTASGVRANPAYSHVVVVVEENHGFNEIIGGSNAVIAPYINNTLATGGVVLTNAYGEQHPSQPNYDWLFSGGNQGISNDTPPSSPIYTAPNLYTELQTQFANTPQSNNFFGGFVDAWPGATNAYAPNSDNVAYVNYAQRHVPWLGFSNVNGGNPAAITKDFGANFPSAAAGFSNLPALSMIIPALNNDMHDYQSTTNRGSNAVSNPSNSAIAVHNGDTWLSNNLSAYASWAKSNNSLLIVTWDEDSSSDWATNAAQLNKDGLTAPNLGYNTNNSNGSGSNQIAMIFYGANLATNGLSGADGVNSNGVNNLNLYDTIQSFYGLSNYGTQSDLSINAGLVSAPITNIFSVPEPSVYALIGVGVLLMAGVLRVKV